MPIVTIKGLLVLTALLANGGTAHQTPPSIASVSQYSKPVQDRTQLPACTFTQKFTGNTKDCYTKCTTWQQLFGDPETCGYSEQGEPGAKPDKDSEL